MGQKEPPKLGSTICYGQTWARKSHQDSAVRFVTAKSWPENATKTRQYDLLRPNVGQKEPPRLGSTICYGQELATKSHQDSAVRFVTAKRGPERATKTRQYYLLRPRVGQKEPPRLGGTICYDQELARKSHQDSAVRFVTAKSWLEIRFVTTKRGPERAFVTAKRGPERATETRQCFLLRPRVWPERATKTRQYDLLRPNVGQKEPPRLGSTICHGQELARKSHRDSAYDLLRPNVGQKEPPRLGSTICYGQELARRSHQDSAVRFVTAKSWPEKAAKTVCYGQELAERATSAVRFVTVKHGPERVTKTRQYDMLRPNVGQKEPPRLGSTICYGQELSRKSHQDSAVLFVTANRGPERATKTRQCDLLRPNVGQKEPPRLGSTICYGQEWPERATETRQCYLLRPNVGQKEPPRFSSTICCGQTCARKSHQKLAVRFVTAKSWPERATKTRQYDL